MIVAGHRQSGFKTDVLRGRGWHALSGLGQVMGQVTSLTVPCPAGSPSGNICWTDSISGHVYILAASGDVIDTNTGQNLGQPTWFKNFWDCLTTPTGQPRLIAPQMIGGQQAVKPSVWQCFTAGSELGGLAIIPLVGAALVLVLFLL